jgi:YgiT-type zinc finger domain-containing protein
MRQKSGKMICSLCGGQLEQKQVRVVRERHEQPVLFENVPAKVCKKCGHRWFGLPVVREMEKKLSNATAPVSTLCIPVYALNAF